MKSRLELLCLQCFVICVAALRGSRVPARSLRCSTTAGLSAVSVTDPEAWPLGSVAFSLLPLFPGSRRKTLQTTVVKDKIWTHDQAQGIVNVNVPVRQTVIKLKGGGLWVHNPVAPTEEHLAMIRALEAEHGAVKHIVLGTVALEHKVVDSTLSTWEAAAQFLLIFSLSPSTSPSLRPQPGPGQALAGPFSSAFPNAAVWLQPGQWSFPIQLPPALFGFRAPRMLPTDKALVPHAHAFQSDTMCIPAFIF